MSILRNPLCVSTSIIVIGCMLAFTTAVVPHYSDGYQLLFSVLLAGLSPYLAYGMLAWLTQRPSVLVAGIVLLAVHVWLTIDQRFLHYNEYANQEIYYIPALIAIVLMGIVFVLISVSDFMKHEHHPHKSVFEKPAGE